MWLIESSNYIQWTIWSDVRRRCHNKFSVGTDCRATVNTPRQNNTNYEE